MRIKGGFFIILLLPAIVWALSVVLHLPYIYGDTQLVTRAYVDQTHNGKDRYALDFAKAGCEGWNSPILAAADGVVIRTQTGHIHGEKNSYGNQVLIEHADGIVTRYAHLHDVNVDVGQVVQQGEQIGSQGNTGSVWGQACPDYPGTHLHFVVYKQEGDTLLPVKPEPLSGYSSFSAGHWYVSDNQMSQNEEAQETVVADSINKQQLPWWKRLWAKAKDVFGFSSDIEEVETVYIPETAIQDARHEHTAQAVPIDTKLATTSADETSITSLDTQKVSIVQSMNEQEQQHIENDKDEQKDPVFFIPNSIVEEVKEVHKQLVEKTKEIQEEVISKVPAILGGGNSNMHTPQSTSQTENTQKEQKNTSDPEVGAEDSNSSTIHMNPIISILSPSSSPFFTSSTEITIVGYKNTDVQEVFVNSSSDGVTYSASSSWQKIVSLEEGINTFTLYGAASDGSISAINSHEIILDTQAPSVSSFGAQVLNVASGTIRLLWNAVDVGIGVDSYDVEEYVDSNWERLDSSTTSTGMILVRELFDEYNFRIRVYDTLGNRSDWYTLNEAILLDYPRSVVINEIAWMGTDAQHVNDEWIELYNSTNDDIDIADWYMEISGRPINWQKEQTIIPAKGYYLLERSDDHSVDDIQADGIFTVVGGLKNTGEIVRLYNAQGDIVDEIDAQQGWPAGEVGTFYKSMERIHMSSASSSWQTADGFSLMGIIAGGGQKSILGTPKQDNHAPILLRDITEYYADKIVDNQWQLHKEDGPYIIDYITRIPEELTLYIEPGTMFMGRSPESTLVIQGRVIARGSEQERIRFSSLYDVVSSSERVPQAGDWSHIEIAPGGIFLAEYVDFAYCGHPYTKGNDWVYGDLLFSQCISNFSGELGVQQSIFEHGYVHEQDKQMNAYVWMDQASTSIRNSNFIDGHAAILAENSTFIVEESSFQGFDDSRGPIYAKNTAIETQNILFIENNFNGISLSHLTVEDSYILGPHMSYKTGAIEVKNNGELFIKEGTNLFIKERNDIIIDGVLHSQGTQESPVLIRPMGDDRYWGSLFFDHAEGYFSHTMIEKGNHGGFSGRQGGMIVAEDSSLSFEDTLLQDARRPYNMVYAKNSDMDFRDSELRWNNIKEQPSWFIVGVEMNSSSIHLYNTRFHLMDRGVNGSGVGIMQEMDETFFSGISDRAWWPDMLFQPEEEAVLVPDMNF